MKPNIQTKICEVCGEAFTPDPRVGNRQRVCKKLSCQAERKHRAQKRWVEKNPGYFTGRYPYLKQWLKEHPDYLKNYRHRGKSPSKPVLFDIQDELTSYKNNKKKSVFSRFRDIQDELIACYNKQLLLLRASQNLIYKTS